MAKVAAAQVKHLTLADIKVGKKDGPMLAAICYILSTIVAVIIYVIEKEDNFVRFHALQAIAFEIAFILLWIVLYIVTFLSFFTIIGAFIMIPIMFLVAFAFLGINFYFAYLAFTGKVFEIPYVTEQILKFL